MASSTAAPLIQQHLSACLVRAMVSREDLYTFDPTAQAPFQALAALFAAGEPFDPSVPLFSEHARHDDLLASLESELSDVNASGTVPQFIRMGKTIAAFLTLAARHGWDPVVNDTSSLATTATVNARAAIAEGHRQALLDEVGSRPASPTSRKF